MQILWQLKVVSMSSRCSDRYMIIGKSMASIPSRGMCIQRCWTCSASFWHTAILAPWPLLTKSHSLSLFLLLGGLWKHSPKFCRIMLMVAKIWVCIRVCMCSMYVQSNLYWRSPLHYSHLAIVVIFVGLMDFSHRLNHQEFSLQRSTVQCGRGHTTSGPANIATLPIRVTAHGRTYVPENHSGGITGGIASPSAHRMELIFLRQHRHHLYD